MHSPRVDSLASKTVRSIGYKSAARFGTYGLQALTTIVLARNLSARDYGVAGYAMIFIGFLASFNDLGLISALVQRKTLEPVVVDAAFSLRVILGVVAFAAAWVVAPLAAASFGDPAVTQVMRILSLGFLVSIVGFIPSALLLRDLDFGRWVVATLLGSALRAGLACFLAVRGLGYWSIVAGNLAGSGAEALCFLCFSKGPLRFRLDRRAARDLLHFGLPIFTSGLLTFALFNADNLVIGAVSGAVLLGYYAVAFNWGSIFSKAVYEVLHSVLFPAFSRLQDEHGVLRRTYLRMMEQISVFGGLFQMGLLVCSRDFLVVVLGKGSDKWLPAVVALQILSVYGLIRLLVEPVGNVLIASGRTRLLFRANLWAAVCEIALLYPAIKFGGIEGVAILVTVSYSLQCLVYWPFVSTHLAISARDLGRVLLPAVAAAGAAVLAGFLATRNWPVSWRSLTAKIGVVAAVYLLVQGTLSSWRWWTDWKSLMVRTKRC